MTDKEKLLQVFGELGVEFGQHELPDQQKTAFGDIVYLRAYPLDVVFAGGANFQFRKSGQFVGMLSNDGVFFPVLEGAGRG